MLDFVIFYLLLEAYYLLPDRSGPFYTQPAVRSFHPDMPLASAVLPSTSLPYTDPKTLIDVDRRQIAVVNGFNGGWWLSGEDGFDQGLPQGGTQEREEQGPMDQCFAVAFDLAAVLAVEVDEMSVEGEGAEAEEEGWGGTDGEGVRWCESHCYEKELGQPGQEESVYEVVLVTSTSHSFAYL